LVKRYGAVRMDEACATALEVEMVDIHRLRRLLEIAPPKLATPAAPSQRVVPLARFQRPAKQFALSFSSKSEDTKGETKA
jgi:hypothetical protein